MSKTKTPYFSFGARGSVGGSITAQKLRGETLVRGKPCPTDPKSLSQLYQRWDYQDGCFYWQSLSLAQREAYREAAAKRGLPVFAYFMRVYLATLPDLVARWRLDETTGVIAYDSSPNGLNGTIIGASPAAGIISGGRYYDGINDLINMGLPPLLSRTGSMTIEAFINPSNITEEHRIIAARDQSGVNRSWSFYVHTDRYLYWLGHGTPGWRCMGPLNTIIQDVWQHVAGTYESGVYARTFVNGNLMYEDTDVGDCTQTDALFYLGYTYSNHYMRGTQDQVCFWNRALSPEQIKAHSLRRYPAQ